ncbi:MAG: hypothetical protein RR767_14045 [Acinetobacter sp.]
MMPNNALSGEAINSSFYTPNRSNPLIDYEYGGIAIGDVSQGMQAKLWKCFYENKAIKISSDQYTETLFSGIDIDALSFSFDQNMRPILVFNSQKHCYLWWYDAQTGNQTLTDFGLNISFPQLALDERRYSQSANSDVIFSYIKNTKLCMRIQRERFQTEYQLTDAKQVLQIGMMLNNRFGFAYYNW